jgi:H+-translocating NAD(P) transhydrogenase subunit alpha
MYARNISSLLLYMVKDGEFTVDLTDELVAGVVVTHEGKVVHPALTTAAAK